MPEDLLLHGPELGRGLEPEVVESRPGVPVRSERIGLAARPVERQHALPLKPLTVRVRHDERVELGHDLGVASRREIGGHPSLQCGQTRLLEPGCIGARERLVGELGDSGASP